MSDQTAVEQEQPSVEESDADLEAGFSAVRGEQQPAVQTQPAPEQSAAGGDAAPSGEMDQPQTDEAPVQKDPNAELREQLAQLQSSVRNIAGNFGGLKSELQRLRDLQTTKATQPQGTAAAAEAKKAIEVQLKKVKEEYPELAELFQADLSEILGGIGASGPAGMDESAVDRIVQSRMSRLEERTAKEVLASVHPDWETDIAEKDGAGNPVKIQARDPRGNPAVDANGNPVLVLKPSQEFTNWMQSKSPEFRQTFWNTNSAAFLVKAMSDFKSKRSSAPSPTPQNRHMTQPSKQDRLRSAVVPQARGGSARQTEIDEDAAFSLGFNRVRSGTS